jgi:hypothetical protein
MLLIGPPWQLYGAILLSTILSSFLVWTLPEFLPGKRALALQLCLYHTIVCTALWHSARFIPITLGSGPEKLGMTIERYVPNSLLQVSY